MDDLKEDIIKFRTEVKWATAFWNRHGDRLTFAAFALVLAEVMYFALSLEAEAKTIIIGIAMLFFNKARGTNGGGKNEPV